MDGVSLACSAGTGGFGALLVPAALLVWHSSAWFNVGALFRLSAWGSMFMHGVALNGAGSSSTVIWAVCEVAVCTIPWVFKSAHA
jgi:hypothetical protein